MAEFSRQPAEGANGRIDVLAVGHAPVLQINRRLYRALRGLGWRTELAIPSRLPWAPGHPVEPEHADDPPVHRLDPRGSHLRFWALDGLGALLDRRRPRVVYIENGPDSTMAWTVGGWCRRNGSHLVVNTYENDIPSLADAVRARQPKTVLRVLRSKVWGHLARSRVAHVVAICQDGRKAMTEIGYRDAVTVMPLGFDATLFVPDPARREEVRRNLGLSAPAVAYFGRLTPQKGVHLLAAALGRLKDRPWQFLLDDFEHGANMGWLTQAIDAACIRDRTVTFSAAHDAMPDYMRAADLVVLPSLVKEQYGRVAPEAMACGCAVIVSDIGALPELAGDAGVKVPPGDVEALAQAIRGLLDDPKRRAELAARGQRRAHAELSLDRQAAMLDRLFRSLAGPPAGDGARA